MAGSSTMAPKPPPCKPTGEDLLAREILNVAGDLPPEFNSPRLPKLLAMAGMCFERSIEALATFHRLPRRTRPSLL